MVELARVSASRVAEAWEVVASFNGRARTNAQAGPEAWAMEIWRVIDLARGSLGMSLADLVTWESQPGPLSFRSQGHASCS